MAAEALALWDEKAVFDVVEIQSKQGNWEIIQVVEKDRNFNSKWSSVVQRCIVMLDGVLIILLKGSILPCNLLDSVVLAISREISLVIFCYEVFECDDVENCHQ